MFILNVREIEMEARMEYWKAAPGGYKAMMAVEAYLHESGLEKNLMHMVKLRASQINGCAYCIDMHWKDARAGGESEQRLYGLGAWREAGYYSDRERAALEWTEALTNISDGHVPDAVYDLVHPQFTDKELADLSWAIAAINAWNRVAIAFRSEAGSYRVPRA
ncbi:MAG: carboxymuconolactone decarboxylase family protein [Pseudoxanthomonas sp.]